MAEQQILNEILDILKSNTQRLANLEEGQNGLSQKLNKLGLEFEEHRKDIKIVAEGHSILDRKLDVQAAVLNGIDKRLQNIENQVISHEQKLRLIK